MPIIKSAHKALRSSARKREFNLKRSNDMKEAIKDLKKKIMQKDQNGAKELLPRVYKAIDKAAKRGIIKKNTASRKKAQAARTVKALS